MNSHISVRNEKLAQKVIAGLKSRNMTGYYAESKEQALEVALQLIPEGASVAWGGSVSINEIGLQQAIISGNYQELNRETCKTPEETRAIMLASLDSDYYLCSSNAVTEDGILVNLDGNANRVAAICFGPRHIVMVVGMNKIVPDVQTAVARVRNAAAPCNAQRFPVQTPCKVTGACADCKSPDTICCQLVLTRYSRQKDRIHVILVNEDLGF